MLFLTLLISLSVGTLLDTLHTGCCFSFRAMCLILDQYALVPVDSGGYSRLEEGTHFPKLIDDIYWSDDLGSKIMSLGASQQSAM